MAEAQKKSGTNASTKTTNRTGLITLAVIAVIGWGWGIYQATSRSALETQMTRQIEAATLQRDEVAATLATVETASGELTDIQARIDASNSELAGLEERRQAATRDFDAEVAALAERRNTTETELASELDKMTAQLETARQDFESELATLAKRRDAAVAETNTAEMSLTEIRTQLKETTSQVESQRSELTALEKEIAQRQATREDTEAALTKVRRELATVGARLEAARAQESTLRDTLSALQEEASSLTKELADAETRIQQARSTEANVQEKASQISKEVGALEDRKEQLSATVSELTARHSNVQSDVSAAQEQRKKVQTELRDVTTLLKARSDELLSVEQRITEQQSKDHTANRAPEEDQSDPAEDPQADAQNAASQSGQDRETSDEMPKEGTPNKAAEATQSATPAQKTSQNEQPRASNATASNSNALIKPGAYRTGNIRARFGPDGTFHMQNEERGTEVSGRYTAENGLVTLSNPKGDLRQGVSFPLRCAVASDGKTFMLRDADDEAPSCGPLTGVGFEPVQQ